MRFNKGAMANPACWTIGQGAEESPGIYDLDLAVDLVVAPAFSQHHSRIGGPIQRAEGRCLA